MNSRSSSEESDENFRTYTGRTKEQWLKEIAHYKGSFNVSETFLKQKAKEQTTFTAYGYDVTVHPQGIASISTPFMHIGKVMVYDDWTVEELMVYVRMLGRSAHNDGSELYGSEDQE